ncbi:MAG TPA: trypsin-like peptidase domain-containing protein [Tepidisphaeraceae bacterium]|nr:trypsin-like peptidase domain-containing protein [Tepidisphaeraceae bacterium]
MGRRFAVALLGIGAMSLSCGRAPFAPAARQAGASDRPVLAADAGDPADASPLAGLEAKFESLATRLAPSVVAISASTQVLDADDLLRADELNPEKLETLLDRTTRMVGTGLVIDADGYILTNEHVIGEAENVWVTTDAGKVYPALVVGTDPRQDLAVLKIPATGMRPVTFATPDAPLARGQWAIALGNPYGLATAGNQALSVGVVSAIDRALPKLSKKENRLYSGLVQTTCPINPGNSGGPLFDIHGRVIGINTAVILPEKKTNGIGFAIPVTRQLMETVAGLKDGREVVYAYLGVSVVTPTPGQRRAAGLDDASGVRVETVDRASPADGLLKEGDLLVTVDGRTLRDSEQFVRVVGQAPIDRPTDLTVVRDGKPLAVSATLRKRAPMTAAVTRDSRRMRWEGLLVGPVPAHWTGGAKVAAANASTGLVVLAVSARSKFAKDGVREGDVITAVGGQTIGDVVDLQKLVNDLPPDKRTITTAPRPKPAAPTGNAVAATSRD